jgi:hypothetical protein
LVKLDYLVRREISVQPEAMDSMAYLARAVHQDHKDEEVHPVQLVKEVTLDKMENKVPLDNPLSSMATSSPDIVKQLRSLTVPSVFARCGTDILSFSCKETNCHMAKISVPLDLVSDVSAPCLSCTVMWTTTAALLHVTTTLTG